MSIAAEIEAGLIEAGQETGGGTLVCSLEKPPATGAPGEPATPWDAEVNPGGPPTRSDVIAVEGSHRARDEAGTLVGRVVRTLTVAATGAAPAKADRIAVGVATANVDANTVWSEIAEVRPLQPGGEALMYTVDLVE